MQRLEREKLILCLFSCYAYEELAVNKKKSRALKLIEIQLWNIKRVLKT
jgi:hypothetical protein